VKRKPEGSPIKKRKPSLMSTTGVSDYEEGEKPSKRLCQISHEPYQSVASPSKNFFVPVLPKCFIEARDSPRASF